MTDPKHDLPMNLPPTAEDLLNDPYDRILKAGQPTDNVPDDVDLTPTFATAIGPNVSLFTRDGSKIGNAVIIKQAGHTSSFPGSRDYIPLWLIETDFGNRTKMSESGINTLFTLGYLRDHNRWWDDRLAIIKHHQTDQSKYR